MRDGGPCPARFLPLPDQSTVIWGLHDNESTQGSNAASRNCAEEAQEQLAEIAFEIDAELKGGVYHATPDELAGIDRGLKAAREGRLATDEEVEAVFAKRRGA